MKGHNDFNFDQLFSRDERDFLSLAAQRAEEVGEGAEGFGNRVGLIIDELRTDELQPAVIHGRFSLLLHWMDHNPDLAESLYDYFREGVLGQ